jgi:hypothetical protein
MLFHPNSAAISKKTIIILRTFKFKFYLYEQYSHVPVVLDYIFGASGDDIRVSELDIRHNVLDHVNTALFSQARNDKCPVHENRGVDIFQPNSPVGMQKLPPDLIEPNFRPNPDARAMVFASPGWVLEHLGRYKSSSASLDIHRLLRFDKHHENRPAHSLP